jgi:hypothetical protein
MLELIQITNDAAFARRCDALGRFRLFVDLERLGKAERQAGRNTFISVHGIDDVGRIREALRQSRLMVRVNPLHEGTRVEVDAVLARGADLVMLPMFTQAAELHEFSAIVGGRAPIVPLLETAAALDSLDEWIATPGLGEVYVGLNDLHISLGQRFMFEPLALGLVDRVAAAAKRQGLPFGFGGIARVDEGQVSGRDVLAEHVRLGSSSVILSRTFHHGEQGGAFEAEVAKLRHAEQELASRSAVQIDADARRIAASIRSVAAAMGAAR